MRHGCRAVGIDGGLQGYSAGQGAPEVWQSVHQIVTQQLPVLQIVTSPYLRTRQTALLVQHSYLKLTGTYLPIHVDLRLGEYQPRHCRLLSPDLKDFDSETVAHYRGCVPLCRESPDALVQRVAQFYNSLPSAAIVVTHYGIAELLGLFARQAVKLQEGHFALLTPMAQTQLISSPAT
jgi:broad specificity phosphatase PhoE